MIGFKQVLYYTMCLSHFARAKNISPQEAYNYLDRYKGIEFLIECYDAEHTLSFDDAVEDLTILCKNNGGTME